MSSVFPIEDKPRYQQYTATAGQVLFAIPFNFQQTRDIQVQKTPAAGGGPVPLTQPADYTVTGAGVDAGGSFTLSVGAVDGDVLEVWGEAVIDRTGSVVQSGQFKARAHDDEHDRHRIIQQELSEGLSRAIRGPRGQTAPEIVGTIGAGKALVTDADGNLVEGPSAGEIIAAEGYAETAQEANSEINRIWQGNQASDPTVNLNGDPLVGGEIYFNTVAEEARTYENGQWKAIAAQPVAPTLFEGTGNGVDNTITLPIEPPSGAFVMLTVGGEQPTAQNYSVSGTTLTLTDPIPDGTEYSGAIWSSGEIGVPSDGTIGASKLDLTDKSAIQTALDIPALADVTANTSGLATVQSDIANLKATHVDLIGVADATGAQIDLSALLDAGEGDFIIDCNIKPGAVGSAYLRFSDDGGVSWLSTAYRGVLHWQIGTSVTYGHTTSRDSMWLGPVHAAAGGTVVTVSTQLFVKIRAEGTWVKISSGIWSDTGNMGTVHGWTYRQGGGVDAIQIYTNGGSTSDFEYTVRKIKRAS